MDFDQATGQLILFGGRDSNGTLETHGTGAIGTAIPVANATPASQTICSGSLTSIALSSNVAGTTFSWTVVEIGVSGAFADSGESIVQLLNVNSNFSGTATYTITPTSPGGCIGASINVVVTVNPVPTTFTNPPSQNICTGEQASIFLSSSLSGTTFSWTVVENGVTGASAGSGTTIAQILNATTATPGTATYTITSLSPGGCAGTPVEAIVTVTPTVIAIASPSGQTICNGGHTSINLTSNIPDTFFSWTVVESGVTGAFDDSGESIVQTLTTTANADGTATYTVTPSVNGCLGNPIDVVVSVEPLSPRSTPSLSWQGQGNIGA